MTPEVLTMGRVSVDLYPEQIGVPLAQVRTFRKMLGGSPTNVAVAAARLGRRATVVTKVGTDGFGDYVREALAGFGVDPSLVGTDPELRTPLAFCELHPPDDFPLLFYRQPTAPDLQLRDVDLAAAPITEVPLLWMTGTGLSEEPEGAGNSVRPVGAVVGRIVGCLSHASIGCLGSFSNWRCCVAGQRPQTRSSCWSCVTNSRCSAGRWSGQTAAQPIGCSWPRWPGYFPAIGGAVCS